MNTDTFMPRMLVTVCLVTALLLLLLLLWYAADVLLLIFASVLVAIFLRGLTHGLNKYTPLSAGWSLAVVTLLLTALFSLGLWLLAPNLAEQLNELRQGLSGAWQRLERVLGRYQWIQMMLSQVPPISQLVAGQGTVLSRVTGVFSSGLGVFTNFVIIMAIGFYLATNPSLYTGGLVRLMPRARRPQAREVLGVLGYTLRWWLIGRLVIMAINGAVTALGLWLLGVPLAVTLGLLTALLNFIPNLGPILAGIPAVLIALTQSPLQALYVLLLYVAIQGLEGFLLTPLLQQYTVSIPPALTLTVQVLFGVLLGILGVMLAVPLTAIILVLVKLLYLERWLGEPVDLPGRDEQKKPQTGVAVEAKQQQRLNQEASMDV